MCSSCLQSLSEYRRIILLYGGKNIGIVKISGTGIKHSPAQDRFHLFCQDSFDVVSPQLEGFAVIKDLIEGELHL